MKMILVLMIAVLFATNAFGEGFKRPIVWKIQNLVGLANNYDGPSCYTAAMVALGYVDNVSYVGTKELEFYLDNFCVERTAGEARQVGDLLTLTDTVSVSGLRSHNNHVAVYMGNETVFEKENGNGLIDPYSDYDPHFFLRPMAESRWFKNFSADGQQLRAYQCLDAKQMRQKIAQCEARANALGMAELRREQERVTFSSPPKFEFSSASVKTVERITAELRHISTADPCYDYMIAMGEVLTGSFKSSRQKLLHSLTNAAEFWKAREELDSLMFQKFGI